jgi:Ca2+-transporting ATPase
MVGRPLRVQDARTARLDLVKVAPESPWFTQDVADVSARLNTDVDAGLTSAAATAALAAFGPNTLPTTPRRSSWSIALATWGTPMNIMLTVVAVISFAIGQVETGALISFLVLVNVIMGARQEINALTSVEALQSMQVPSARARRDDALVELPAADLVPGDVVLLEAGDLVPADGRIAVAARLEVAESALTGESAPVAKGAEPVADPDTALGDRSSMLFQNTSVTRGTVTLIVTATGSATEMGTIAGMLGSVQVAQSPLQREVRGLTIRLAIIAWVAVAIIVALGLWRGLDTNAVILLGITTAISAIPSGLPTFLTGMLSFGAQRLAKAQAVVKSLNDVETLGSTTAINSDKTGTLTMDMMTATRMYAYGQWFTIDGTGYAKQGAILHAAGKESPDFTMLAYGLALSGDATVDSFGGVVGDPTEAALVVLAAKMGVDAQESRREYPRIAEVPFDSAYKFMATIHEVELDGELSVVVLVKGAPDVVLDRSTDSWGVDERTPIGATRSDIISANEQLAEQGLRVMSFAARVLPLSERDAVVADPMAAVNGLAFVALVGIIDPLRPSAKDAITVALKAGIDVRMITGDHAVTAKAIGTELGLKSGVITGPELHRLTDEQLLERLPDLHVFGRVSPEDKLRMVTLMQQRGDIVAMTGDAVNDAAALKKADIGVAMGSGSDVTKQSAKMILLDDNFATLVHAIELGRDIYGKVSAQIRYVLTGLFGLLGIMLGASLLNLNDGNVLTAVQLLFVSFLIGLFPAIALSTDTAEPGLMLLPPRDPRIAILNRQSAPLWVVFGLTQAVVSLLPFAWQSLLGVPTAQTMTFGILALSTIWLAASMRRARLPLWAGPLAPFWAWMAIPLLLSILAIELPFPQVVLLTTSLTGLQWLVVLVLSLVVPLVIESAKALQRRRARAA